MIIYRIGDPVGAQGIEDKAQPVFGRIHSIEYGGYIIRDGDNTLTGPWPYEQVWKDISAHVDYPHHPGTLYDCPACEAIMEPNWKEIDPVDSNISYVPSRQVQIIAGMIVHARTHPSNSRDDIGYRHGLNCALRALVEHEAGGQVDAEWVDETCAELLTDIMIDGC